MLYVSEFYSINSKLYKVELTTGGERTPVASFKLAGTPFKTEMDSDKHIYSPIKAQGGTITMLTDSLPLDLYAKTAKGTKIEVKSGTGALETVHFTGYLTPCAYTQPYDHEIEELEMECVDGLCVLKELPYRSSKKNEAATFLSIIMNCLRQAECFSYIYISDNVQMTATSSISITDKLRVSEQNFFTEKDYDGQPDDDVAMSCYDVLWEIMQYLGMTMTAVGDKVYCLDYDAIRKGHNTYIQYDISASPTPLSGTLSHTHKIKPGSYAESGTTITLTEIYNKLTVKDDFYTIDTITDAVDNVKNWINITAPTDPRAAGSWIGSSSNYLLGEVFTFDDGDNFYIGVIKNDSGQPYFVMVKFYRNPLITTYHYSMTTNVLVSNAPYESDMMYSKLWDAKGANLVAELVQPIDSDTYNRWLRPIQNGWNRYTQARKLEKLGELVGLNNLQNKKLTKYILCMNQDDHHISHELVKAYPYFTIKKDVPAVFGGESACIIISGTLLRHDQWRCAFPLCGKQGTRKNTSIYKGESYFWAQLRWGTKYFTDDTYQWGEWKGQWVDRVAYFRIYYGDPLKEQKSADFFDKDLPIYNTAALVWGLNENGYYVPAPEGQNLEGTIEFTVFANKDTKGHKDIKNGADKKNSYDTYKPRVVFFKNLDIKLVYEDDTLKEEEAKEDTYYTNEVDGRKVEADDMSFKICTPDDKTSSYSTVTYHDDAGANQNIDKLYNAATQQSLRQEEQMIVKFVSQYSDPRVKLKCELRDDTGIKPWSLMEYGLMEGKKFIVDAMDRDYREDKVTATLVEKTNQYK